MGSLVVFLVLTALPAGPVRAEDEGGSTEVEFAVAEGSGSGSFGCGQQTRVRSVRAAGQLRHSEHPKDDPRGQGITVMAGAAVEAAEVTVIEAPTDADEGRPVGESWLEGRGGGHLRVGYRHRFFGIEGGGGFVILPESGAVIAFPDLELSVGLRDVLYFMGGVGSSQLTTQLSYAHMYLGMGCAPSRWFDFEARWGIHHGGFVAADRADVIWRVRMNREWAFRGGLALGEFEGQPSFAREASIGLEFSR